MSRLYLGRQLLRIGIFLANKMRKVLGSLALVGSVLGGATLAVAAPASAAPTAATCGYGANGPDATKICWFDFSGYDDAQAKTAAGQDMKIALPDGGSVSFNLTTVVNSGTPITYADDVPVWERAVIGKDAYVGTPGQPALRATRPVGSTPTSTTFTMRNITFLDASGQPAVGYNMVSADAESTFSTERITWNSNIALSPRAIIRPSSGSGAENGCAQNIIGGGTTTLTCTGNDGTWANERWGSLLIDAYQPSTLSATVEEVHPDEYGTEAVMFGVMPPARGDGPIVDPTIAGFAGLAAAGALGGTYMIKRNRKSLTAV